MDAQGKQSATFKQNFEINQAAAEAETVGPSGVADQPTPFDSLGFKPYVQAVAAFLTHPDTKAPLTVSVEGPWGSGKSSFMQQLQLEVKHCLDVQHRVTLSIWFNAWRQNKDEELWAAFALHFSEEISAQLSWFRRRWCHLKLHWLRFDMKKAWLDVAKFLLLALFFVFASFRVGIFIHHNPTALCNLIEISESTCSPETQIKTADSREHSEQKKDPDEMLLKLILASLGSAGYIVLAFMFLKKGSELIGNPLKIDLEKYIADPKYDNRVAFIETFQADFRKMVKCFASDETIFIFIDDLDRCEVPRSAELMQALNLLISDSPNIIYILGLDREKIAAGIAAKFKDVLPYLTRKSHDSSAAADFGFNYLEKFIQIPFQVPRPSVPDVDRLMKDINRDAPEPSKITQSGPHVDPGILFETKVDSELVRGIVRMVSPAFEFNPRRIKQFINCFRVHAIIASQTGMFAQTAARPNGRRPLSPQHLGKLIAICLRWPRLLNEIAEHPNFFDRFPYQGPYHSPETLSPLEYWSRDDRLLELIVYGTTGPEKPEYSMEGIDTARFLTVAPRIRQPQSDDVQRGSSSNSPVQIKQVSDYPKADSVAYLIDERVRPTDIERDWYEEGSDPEKRPPTRR